MQRYNPSNNGVGRSFAKWKRSFLVELPTEVRDLLLGDAVVIPDVEERKAQMQQLQVGINEYN